MMAAISRSLFGRRWSSQTPALSRKPACAASAGRVGNSLAL
jgi:hypothetical protein